MKTLLAGNGINIQFGGNAYTSRFIIERMKCNAKIKKYDPLFANTISGEELVNLFQGFVSLANRILTGECDKLEMDQDLRNALDDFKSRYSSTCVEYPRDIMLEDWFFVFKMYAKLYHAQDEAWKGEEGFRRLFLDAIYNDGKIQNIYKNVGKKVRRFIKSFDTVYTVNYDSNLENLTAKPVYHLHGSFTELQASVNPEYAMGYLNIQSGNSIIVPSFEHCFCNALLSYSGDLKYKDAKMMHQVNMDAETMSMDEVLKISSSETKKVLGTHKSHPELKIAPEYHFDDFENIQGELDVIGLSPNNDQHIINMIRGNSNITEIKYYYNSEKDKKKIIDFRDDRFETCNVKELWTSLDVDKPKQYNNYNFQPNFSEQLKGICTLSDFQATEEDIQQEVNSLPPYKIKSICDEAFEELKKHDALHSHTKRNENGMEVLTRNFAYISHVATTEGILPPTLLTLLTLHWHEYRDDE